MEQGTAFWECSKGGYAWYHRATWKPKGTYSHESAAKTQFLLWSKLIKYRREKNQAAQRGKSHLWKDVPRKETVWVLEWLSQTWLSASESAVVLFFFFFPVNAMFIETTVIWMRTSGINSHGNKQLLWRWAVGLMAPSVCHIVSLLASIFLPLPPAPWAVLSILPSWVSPGPSVLHFADLSITWWGPWAAWWEEGTALRSCLNVLISRVQLRDPLHVDI